MDINAPMRECPGGSGEDVRGRGQEEGSRLLGDHMEGAGIIASGRRMGGDDIRRDVEAAQRDESDVLGTRTGVEDGLLEWYVNRQGECMEPKGRLTEAKLCEVERTIGDFLDKLRAPFERDGFTGPASTMEGESEPYCRRYAEEEQIAEMEGEEETDNVGTRQVEEKGNRRQQGGCLERRQE